MNATHYTVAERTDREEQNLLAILDERGGRYTALSLSRREGVVARRLVRAGVLKIERIQYPDGGSVVRLARVAP